jgi:NitT/TauT family transport system permease protein
MTRAVGDVIEVSVVRGRPWLAALQVRKRLLQALSVVVFVGVWWLVAHLGGLPSYILPSPEKAGATFLDELTSGQLADNLLKSARHYTLGLTCGVSLGIVIGVATARFPTLELLLGPVIAMLRPIPPLAWLPFAIIWFHITTTAAAFLIGIIALWLCLYASNAGVRGVERGLLEVAQTLGVTSNLELLCRVVLPAALPSILTGVRQSLGQSWMAVVAAELLGVRGLGFRMTEAAALLAMDVVVAYMVLMGLVYFTIDSAFLMVEARLLRWR